MGRTNQYVVLPACIVAYFAVRFTQVVIGPIVPNVIETFDVSRSAIGLVLTGMWATYALSQLPSGILADRFGERQIVLTALGIVLAATLGLAVAPTFLVFGIGVLTLGVGAGIYYNPATALLDREFEKTGRTIGIHRIGGQVAGVVAPVAAAILGVRYGWRVTVSLGLVLTALVAVIFARLIVSTAPVRPIGTLRDLVEPGVLRTLLTRPYTRHTVFMATIVEFVGLAVMAFLSTFLVEHSGFTLQLANVLFAVFFAVATVSQPIGGWLSDYLGRDATLAIQLSAGVLGYGTLVADRTLVLTSLGIVLAGISMSSVPVIQSRMLDRLSQTNRGVGFGLFRTVYMLFGALGTTVTGTIAETVGWTEAFGVLSILLSVNLLSLFLTRINR